MLFFRWEDFRVLGNNFFSHLNLHKPVYINKKVGVFFRIESVFFRKLRYLLGQVFFSLLLWQYLQTERTRLISTNLPNSEQGNSHVLRARYLYCLELKYASIKKHTSNLLEIKQYQLQLLKSCWTLYQKFYLIIPTLYYLYFLHLKKSTNSDFANLLLFYIIHTWIHDCHYIITDIHT